MGSRERENQAFVCAYCQQEVLPLLNGSYRNHCPFCLHSLHVDADRPGDRASECHGLMKPVGLEVHKKKGYQILFRCTLCGAKHRNKVADDDPRQPDDIEQIAALPMKG